MATMCQVCDLRYGPDFQSLDFQAVSPDTAQRVWFPNGSGEKMSSCTVALAAEEGLQQITVGGCFVCNAATARGLGC